MNFWGIQIMIKYKLRLSQLMHKIKMAKYKSKYKNYRPLAYIETLGIYESENSINPLLNLLYNIRNIGNYTIIDIERDELSIVLRPEVKPVVIYGKVIDIKETPTAVIIKTVDDLVYKLLTGALRYPGFDESAVTPMTYVFNKDLSLKTYKIFYSIGFKKGTLWAIASFVLSTCSKIKALNMEKPSFNIAEYGLSLIDRFKYNIDTNAIELVN